MHKTTGIWSKMVTILEMLFLNNCNQCIFISYKIEWWSNIFFYLLMVSIYWPTSLLLLVLHELSSKRKCIRDAHIMSMVKWCISEHACKPMSGQHSTKMTTIMNKTTTFEIYEMSSLFWNSCLLLLTEGLKMKCVPTKSSTYLSTKD